MKSFIVIFLSIILIFNISLCYAEDSKNNIRKFSILKHETTKSISESKFLDHENNFHSLEEYEDKTVLLVFWATWCTFCTDKMKSLDRLQKLYKKEPFKIIALSQDFKGIPTIQDFYKKKDIQNLEIFLDQKNSLFKEFKIVTLPTAILINNKSKEVARIIGAVNWDTEKDILDLINETIK